MITGVTNRNTLKGFGEIKQRRTADQIAADKKRRGKSDHLAQIMDRNLEFDAVKARNRLAEKKETEKTKKADEKPEKELPVLEDMVPRVSLHKITV